MKSPLCDIEIPTDQGVAHVLLEKTKEFGSRKALVDGLTGRTLTYADLREQIFLLSGALRKRGLRHDNVVLLVCPNCVEYPIVVLAVTYLSGIISTINPQATPEELQRRIIDSRCDYVVTHNEVYDKVQTVILGNQSYKIQTIYTIGSEIAPDGATSINSMLHEAKMSTQLYHTPTVDARHQVAVLPYSSGTTGIPKGVMLTHYNLLANIYQMSHPQFNRPLTAMSYEDVAIGVLPFFHIYGMTILMLYTLFKGDVLVILPRFRMEEFLQTIEQFKVTLIYIVPPIALQIATNPLVDKYDLSSVSSLFCGAAPIGLHLVNKIKARLHIQDFRQGYGMTETSPGILHPPFGHNKPQSVGIPLPNTEIKIVEPTKSQHLGANKKGELWIRGPQVMKGYYGNPYATRNCLNEEGWLKTGDIGYYDSDGFFFIVNRIKEIIKYKGFQVSPAELEALLLKHPNIGDAAVVGVPDEEAGYLPRAYIVLKPGCTVSETDIKSYIAGHVVSYKQLRGGVEVISHIPKNPSGKILRRILEERAQKIITSQL